MSPPNPRPEQKAGGPRAWRPTAIYRASAGLHAAGLAALVAQPDAWGWAAAAIGANHALLAAAGLAPRSRLLGENLVALPAAATARREIALTFDDGPDPAVTPRVLDALDRAGARATFFCVGERVARHAALAREIVRRGHAVENHSHRHSTAFGWYGPRRLRAELASAQAAIGDATGIAPAWFRAPFGMRNPLLPPALAALGLDFASWTRRGFDARGGPAGAIERRLCARLAAGDLLVLHDGVATGRRPDATAMLQALDGVLATAARLGLRSVTLSAACAAPAARDSGAADLPGRARAAS